MSARSIGIGTNEMDTVLADCHDSVTPSSSLPYHCHAVLIQA